jgi:CheY-like chemotaxis protein
MNRTVEILVAEDSPTQAAQLQNLLEECGYTVEVATNGVKALQAARQHKPDLIISDIVMPQMDGYQLCKEIKSDETLRNTPVVLVTSLSSPHDVIKGLGCGADSFIRKPYDEKYLISRIEYLRANQALRQQQQGQMGLEMYLGGQRHFITAERQQILDLLISTYTEAIRLNEGLNRSNQWLHGLYRIAEGLNQADSEREVCEVAVAGAVELPGIKAGWILLNEEESAARMVAAEGLSFGTDAESLEEESLAELGEPAAISLWAGDQTFGVMKLVGIEQTQFSNEDLSILQGIGNQVGIALERAHLRTYLEKMVEERTAELRTEVAERKAAEEEARRQAARAEALVRSASRLNADLDLDVILSAICEETSQALNVPVVTLSLYDKESEHFYHVKDLGLPPEYRELVQPVRRVHDKQLLESVNSVRSDPKRSLLIYEIDVLTRLQYNADDPNVELYAPFGIRTMVSMDLTYAQELIGRFTIYTLGEPRPFTEDELTLLQGLGNQAAQAIANARLFTDAQRRMEQLHALHAIDNAIIAVQELPVSLDIIVQQIATQLQVDTVGVLLYDSQTETLSYVAGTGSGQEAIRHTHQRLGKGMVGRIAAKGQFHYVANLHEVVDFQRAPMLRSQGFVSYMGVPLMVQGELKGVLELFHRAPLDPKPEWLEFLQALALQTAIATAHAELFSQTQLLLQRTQEEARKVKQVMDTVPEGVIFLDQEYRIQLANEAGEAHLGLLTDATVGEVLAHLGDHPFKEVVTSARSVAWQEVWDEEGKHIFEVAARPMQVNAHVDGWVLVLRDVTFERHNQQRLQMQERLATVGQLAAGIAHDFNNLLVPIMLYTELMIAHVSRESRMWNNLDKIMLAANRAKELVRQILAFSRQGPLQKREPVQLQRHIKEVLKLMWASLPPTIEVRQSIAPNIGSVMANPVEIHQILMNLCTNAYHAMQRSGGVLTVRLDKVDVDADFVATRSHLREGPYVRLSVSDTGHGIEPETMERIFDPFFTTKAAGEGTGMGLSVVYGIVMSYGGDITVDSAPGKGTTFSIYLPQLATVLEGEENASSPLTGGNERILLVDDEEGIVHVTKTLLESIGYHVTAYTSSVEALANFQLHAYEFDLVITDLTMPQMNGVAFAKALLGIRPNLPILLVSGAHENFTAENAHELGVDASLMKPYLATELSTRIRYLLDAKVEKSLSSR